MIHLLPFLRVSLTTLGSFFMISLASSMMRWPVFISSFSPFLKRSIIASTKSRSSVRSLLRFLPGVESVFTRVGAIVGSISEGPIFSFFFFSPAGADVAAAVAENDFGCAEDALFCCSSSIGGFTGCFGVAFCCSALFHSLCSRTAWKSLCPRVSSGGAGGGMSGSSSLEPLLGVFRSRSRLMAAIFSLNSSLATTRVLRVNTTSLSSSRSNCRVTVRKRMRLNFARAMAPRKRDWIFVAAIFRSFSILAFSSSAVGGRRPVFLELCDPSLGFRSESKGLEIEDVSSGKRQHRS